MVYLWNFIEHGKTRVIFHRFLYTGKKSPASDCIEQQCRGCGGEQCQLCREDVKTIERCVSTCIDVSCKGCGGRRGNGSFGVEIKDPHHGVSVLKGSTWMISGYPRFRKLSPWFPFEITFHFHFNTIKTQTVYRKNTSKSRFLGQSHFPRHKSAARRSVSAVPRGRYDQAELLRELRGPHVQGWMKKLWLNGILGYFMMIHESLVT